MTANNDDSHLHKKYSQKSPQYEASRRRGLPYRPQNRYGHEKRFWKEKISSQHDFKKIFLPIESSNTTQ